MPSRCLWCACIIRKPKTQMIKSHYASKHGSMQKVLLYKPRPKKTILIFLFMWFQGGVALFPQRDKVCQHFERWARTLDEVKRNWHYQNFIACFYFFSTPRSQVSLIHSADYDNLSESSSLVKVRKKGRKRVSGLTALQIGIQGYIRRRK